MSARTIAHRPDRFTAAISHVLTEDRINQATRSLMLRDGDDERLIALSHRLNEVGSDVAQLLVADDAETRNQCRANLQHDLATLAAFTLLWATNHERTLKRGVEAVQLERQRQQKLFLAGAIAFDCASSLIDDRRKFRVLFEECGEVAHAIDQVENHGMAPGNRKVELIQVTAVCVAWMESLEVES